VTPSEALQHILTLVETSAELKDDTQRKVLLRGVVVVAQKGLGVAPDGGGRMRAQRLDVPYAVGEQAVSRGGGWLTGYRHGGAVGSRLFSLPIEVARRGTHLLQHACGWSKSGAKTLSRKKLLCKINPVP
jgi:hypothetical protein